MSAESAQDKVLKAAFGYHDVLVGYACALLRDHALAEDAVQNAYLVITRKCDAYSEGASLLAWCRGIVRLEVFQILRKSQHEIPTEDAMLYDSVADSFEQVQTPEGQAVAGERRKQLLSCLEKLPERSRQLLTGRYVDDLGLAALSAKMDMSESAVRKSIYRIRCSLRLCLEQEGPAS